MLALLIFQNRKAGPQTLYRVYMAFQLGGAGEGQLFGWEILQLKLEKLSIRKTTDPSIEIVVNLEVACYKKKS